MGVLLDSQVLPTTHHTLEVIVVSPGGFMYTVCVEFEFARVQTSSDTSPIPVSPWATCMIVCYPSALHHDRTDKEVLSHTGAFDIIVHCLAFVTNTILETRDCIQGN